MLRLLVKKQLREISGLLLRRTNGKKRGGKGRLALLIFLAAYLTLLFATLANLLCDPLFAADMGWLYYLLMSLMALIFGTFGSVFTTYSTLYLAKDNDLLLSMPIPVRTVLLSRLLGVYVMGLGYSGLISLPAVVVGWITGGLRVGTLLGGLMLVLLVSLAVLALSALLGWVVARLSLWLKNRSFLIVLISLAFLGLYFYGYSRLMQGVETMLPRLLLLGDRLRDELHPAYLYGRVGEGDLLAMLIWTAGLALLLGLIWLLLKRSFLAVSTATPTPKRAAYREKPVRTQSAAAALRRKEWLRFSGSANYMLNCGLGLLIELALGVYLLVQGEGLLLAAGPLLARFPGAAPVLVCTVCCALSGTVDITAPSVSLEGRSLWQLQCLPVSAWQVLRSKLELHLYLTALPTLFCVIVGASLCPGTLAQRLLAGAVPLLFALWNALLGLRLGLKHANLRWTNETVPIKQSAAVLLTMLAAMGLAVTLPVLYLLLGHQIGATAYLSLVALLLLAADAALFLWLRGPGAKRFAAL